jgi:hypothetical protein
MNMFPKKHVKCNFPDKPLHIYMYIMYPPIRNYDLLMILPSKNRDLTNDEPVSLAENWRFTTWNRNFHGESDD